MKYFKFIQGHQPQFGNSLKVFVPRCLIIMGWTIAQMEAHSMMFLLLTSYRLNCPPNACKYLVENY